MRTHNGHSGRWRRLAAGALAGALAGLLAAGAAIGAGELAAASVRPAAAPVVAVGSRLITLTPEPVKEFAIRHFGTHDKTVLLAGIYLVLAGIAALVGVLARRHRAAGVAGFALFGLVGVAAAVTAPGAAPPDALPSLVAAAAGAATLLILFRTAAVTHPAIRSSDTPSTTGALTQASDLAGGVPVPAGDLAVGGGVAGGGGGVGRRRVLVAGGGAVVFAVVAGVGGRVVLGARFGVGRSRGLVRLPRAVGPAPEVAAGVELGVPGVSRWRTSNRAFYRVDTALSVPQVAAESWRLRVHGMVDRPVTLTFDELLRRPLVERDITLTCVSNQVGGPYAGNARWLGARLADLLHEAGLRPGADQLVSRSTDGMTLGTPTAAVLDGRDALLAVGMNGEPLPVEHGFPVRMVVPGLYGYVSACKWIVDLEATTFGAYDAYWTKRGYATDAPVKTASRIDTPKPFGTVRAGTVTVAGVAWAQRRGIRAVEVRVDDGPWRPAELAAAAGPDTWRQWRYRWAAIRGDHTLRVRATDGTGAAQPAERADPYPDGAAGWHTVTVTVS
jgi:DMSO/TMAO reductase YedYZ molybdopterin-dependent catalytic subunit